MLVRVLSSVSLALAFSTVAAALTPPTPMSTTAPNVMHIGDSVSEGENGYALFVQDMLTKGSGGTLVGSLQHGGGFGYNFKNSNNGVAKITACIGNATGTLKQKAWSVITFNAGLHDCDGGERVEPAAYAANLKAIFETLKPAASAVVFVTTTPWPQKPSNLGICNNKTDLCMSCIREYDAIAKQVAREVGAVVVDDLFEYVEDFCRVFPKKDPNGDYTSDGACAIQSTNKQSTGLHFFNHAPNPSGQQYTGLSVAETVIRLIPEAEIQNTSTGHAPPLSSGYGAGRPLGCGNAPAPLNKKLPNVLIIGDSISEPGIGYGPGVQHIFEQPRRGMSGYQTGPLASVQHIGTTSGASIDGAACVKSWVGAEKWDVITMNFGIHDCCFGVPLADYIKNLGIIYETASQALAPGGKIVWVTTTPVSEGTGAATFCKSGAAFNTYVDDYNAAVLKLLAPNYKHVVVADLHAAVLGVCGTGYKTCNLQRWGDVHFTDAGKQFCAVVVAKNVAPLLAPKWVALQFDGERTDRTCAERGYTTCPAIYPTVRNEPVCCLQANATCCNRPRGQSLAAVQQFFCCPPSLPVCDFDIHALTCRPANYVFTQKKAPPAWSVLERARQKIPRSKYRGQNKAHSTEVLNHWLRTGVQRHGLEPQQKLTPCEAQTLSELHTLQRKMFPMRLPILDEVYQPRHENRRLRKSNLTEFEAVWAAELALAKEWPRVENTLRDGRCHEVIMWWAHHLGPDEQKELLNSGAVLPLLPEVEHFLAGSDDDTVAEAREFSKVDSHVMQTVRSLYKVSVGCGACHIDGKKSQDAANGTTCPASLRDPCMGGGRLNCHPTEPGKQCCAGTVCKEIYIPASDIYPGRFDNKCVPGTGAELIGNLNANVSLETASDRPVHPALREYALRNESATPTTAPPLLRAPILPSSFRANGTYFNESADHPTEPAGIAVLRFNQYGIGDLPTVRVDFSPTCPFFQLHRLGLEANYGPCTVMYRNNTVSYVYHHQFVKCTYCHEDGTAPWHQDNMCTASVLSPNLTINFNNTKNMTVDLWRFEWFQNSFLVLAQLRNWYFTRGSNIPLRVAEDLDTGHTDWYEFEEVASPGISDYEFMEGGFGARGHEYHIQGTRGTSKGCPGIDQHKALKPGETPMCIVVAGINVRKAWPAQLK